MKTTTITTTTLEGIRSQLAKELPYARHVTFGKRTYFTLPYTTPDGVRYNVQVDRRYYQNLTLSALAAVIASTCNQKPKF